MILVIIIEIADCWQAILVWWIMRMRGRQHLFSGGIGLISKYLLVANIHLKFISLSL